VKPSHNPPHGKLSETAVPTAPGVHPVTVGLGLRGSSARQRQHVHILPLGSASLEVRRMFLRPAGGIKVPPLTSDT
jgi:hypothetical protein